MLACIGLEWCLSRYLPLMQFAQAPVHWAGFALIALGATTSLSAAGLFARARTTLIPHGSPSSFVVKGPYKITRNPMYLGLFLVLTGAAALFGAVTDFVVPFLFAALITAVFIRMEESTLTQKFGEEYVRYREHVRRWI